VNITISDLALAAIAVALWLALIIGWNGI